ncbi:MAG TPA: hypothetical protein PKG95_09480 [Anaerolineaceae bacterium]|nr:hypothetical protein [Anaerolineaceae bacterium]
MIEAYWISGCAADTASEAAAGAVKQAGVRLEWVDEAHHFETPARLAGPAINYHWSGEPPADHRLVNLLLHSLATRECTLILLLQTRDGRTAATLLASAAAVGGRNLLARASLIPLPGPRPPADLFDHLPTLLADAGTDPGQIAWVDAPAPSLATAAWIPVEPAGTLFRLNALAEAVQAKPEAAGLLLSPGAGLALLIQRT